MEKNKIILTGGIILLLTLNIFSVREINLIRSDLARHLKNGEIMSQELGSGHLPEDVLYKNLYSYTQPEHPFINHHWAASLIFFWIWKGAGFVGLSVFNFLCRSLALILFYLIAYRLSNAKAALITAVFFLPAASLRDIRPELFTYLFSPVLFWLLWQYRENLLEKKWLLLIPLIMALWVNLNLYFPLGLIIILAFLGENFLFQKDALKKTRVKILLMTLLVSALATLLNPSFIQGALYPLNIHQEIAIPINELKSIVNSHLVNETLFLILLTGVLATLIFGQKISSFIPLPLFWLAFFFLCFLLKYNRNIAISAYFFIIIYSYLLAKFQSVLKKPIRLKQSVLFSAIILYSIFIIIIYANRLNKMEENWGFGLSKNSLSAMEHLNNQRLASPVFNDFTCSSFVIFTSYPNTKVFIDQRPEAYDPSFFSQTYLPALSSEEKWKNFENQFQFKTIIITNKYSDSAYSFYLRRKEDAKWQMDFDNGELAVFHLTGQK